VGGRNAASGIGHRNGKLKSSEERQTPNYNLPGELERDGLSTSRSKHHQPKSCGGNRGGALKERKAPSRVYGCATLSLGRVEGNNQKCFSTELCGCVRKKPRKLEDKEETILKNTLSTSLLGPLLGLAEGSPSHAV